jgi:hypothetical protein
LGTALATQSLEENGMKGSSRALVAVFATAILCFLTAEPVLAGGNVTVKNLSNRAAAVVIETTFDHSSHWGTWATFCVQPGQTSSTNYSHADLFRVKAELRKAGDCRTPNVQGSVETAAYRLAIPTGSGLFGPPGQKPGWLQNHDVIIENGKYSNSWTIRVVSNK